MIYLIDQALASTESLIQDESQVILFYRGKGLSESTDSEIVSIIKEDLKFGIG